MLYQINNPKGIDIPIQKLQKRLFDGLLDDWKMNEGDYNSFSRVYKNKKSNGYIPEAYVGGNEYREVFFDDKVFATSFFSVSDKIELEFEEMRANVSVIFTVNLEKIKAGYQHRADEEARLDAIKLCEMFGFKFISLETGIDNVFKEYNRNFITFRDMHPLHCFRINLSIIYNKC